MAANSKLPFVSRIFWKVLAVIVVLLVASWYVIPLIIDYEITSADYGGSSITAIILSYLVHLWILPGPDSQPDEQ